MRLAGKVTLIGGGAHGMGAFPQSPSPSFGHHPAP